LKKDKEKGRWIKKVGPGKEAQKGTQVRRYKGERTSKKDNEDGKSVLHWNVADLREKIEEEFWDYMRQFEIVGLVET
jgi:hypothetical protein